MATAAPNSMAALSANPFGGDNNAATASSCLEDPNFATICSFIQNFGEIIRIGKIPFDDLQQMLENTADVPLPLVQLHITLLRRVFKSVSMDKWERSLAKFGHMYCSQDAWEVERFGYKKAKIQTKLRLLKNLLEAQFDFNVKFKAEVNKLQAADLRLTPLGRDTEGQVYWYQVDEDANLRVYREDIDDETWDIVASNRDELEELISQLQRGEVKKPEPEETIIVPEEDSNSKDDIEPKEIILDTGKVEDIGSTAENSSESDECEDGKPDKRTVEPLIIKHSFNIGKIHNSEGDKMDSSAGNIKYEISKSTENDKASGIKLVFGVKSRSKVGNAVPDQDVSSSESANPLEEAIPSNKMVEDATPSDLSLRAETAAHQTNIISSKQPEEPTLKKVEEIKAESSDVHAKSPKQKDKSMHSFVDTKSNDASSTELPSKTEEKELLTNTEKRQSLTATPKLEPLMNTEKQPIQTKQEKPEVQANIQIHQSQTTTDKPGPQTNTEQRQSQTKTEKPVVQTSIEQLQLQTKTMQQQEPQREPVNLEINTRLEKVTDKLSVQSKTERQELQVKAAKRDLQARATKNLQKTAKVNSIVERLNRKLPENSAKTVAELLPPPPETTNPGSSSAKDSGNALQNLKSKTEAFPPKKVLPLVTDSTFSVPIVKNDNLVLEDKVQLKKSESLTKAKGQTKIDRQPHKIENVVQKIVSSSNFTTGNIETPKEPMTSIISKSASSEKVIIEEPSVQKHEAFASMKGDKGDTITSVKHSNDSPKDKEMQKSACDLPVVRVPMDVEESQSLSQTQVTEERIEKKKAWICGKEEEPVDEKPIVKEKAWVCGQLNKAIHQEQKSKPLRATHNSPVGKSDAYGVVSKPKDRTEGMHDFLPSSSSSTKKLVEVSFPAALDLVKEKVESDLSHDPNKDRPSSILEKELSKPSVFPDGNKKTFDKTGKIVHVSEDLETTTSIQEKVIGIALPAALDDQTTSIDVKEVKVAEIDPVISPRTLPNELLATKENTADVALAPSNITPTTAAISIEKSAVEVGSKVSDGTNLSKNPIKEYANEMAITSSKSAAEIGKTLSEEVPITQLEIPCVPSGNTPAIKTVSIEKSIIETKNFASERQCVNDSKEKSGTKAESIPSEIHLPANVPCNKEIPKSASAVIPLPAAEEIRTDVLLNVPNSGTSKKDNEHIKKSQSSSPVTEFKGNFNIAPAISSSLSKQDILQSFTRKNEIESSHNVSSSVTPAKEEPDSKDLQLPSKESQNEALPETCLNSAKINSSLVLYSESSESSNEAFIADPKVENADSMISVESQVIGTTSAAETKGDFPTIDQNNQSVLSSNEPEKTHGGLLVKSSAIGEVDANKASRISTISATKTDDKNEKPTKLVEGNTTNVDGSAVPLVDSVSETVSTSSGVDGKPTASTAMKRKADNEVESVSKLQKMGDAPAESPKESTAMATEEPFNPIVGKTVEEEVIIITGEGSGALNEGQNSPAPFNPICGETIEEEVMNISGDGFGFLNEGSNENSPISIAVADVAGSQNESVESEESRDAFPLARGRGGRRGRGRRGRPPATASRERSSQPTNQSRSNNSQGRASRGSREVARLGVDLDSVEVNGENERPVRASRRIAQIRLKEEEERRKLEEERLAQLKAAQMQKKAKQAEKDTKDDNHTPLMKTKKGPGKKSLKNEIQYAPDYIPSGSESEENSEEDDGSDEFSGKLGKNGKRRRRRKNGKAKKGGNPWATSDEDEEEEQVEEEEEYHYEEEEEEELVFKSDHEFSPESDLGEDDEVGPSRHARTAKQDKGDLFEEGNCCKCGKGDHPEWILLCDKCDKGWHASCLRPQLWVVPEGEWFCPPCQHNMLIENLSKNLIEYESLLKKRENEILRKQRLAYVGISLDNVLPDKEPEVPETGVEQAEKLDRESRDRRRQRRRILSDEELSDDFINDNDSGDDLSRSRSGSSNEDSEDEPVYRLRARRSKKAFNFKEYDDMINSALRVDDDEEEVEMEVEKMEQDEDENEEDAKLNGEEKEDDEGAGGGKNDAYLKHLERQAQEEDETDEELLDEKERLRRKELKKHGQRKARRRINDLDAYSDEEDSDDDFKASEAEDEEEELADDGESEWSGDKMEEDSDDSIAKRARRKDRQGRKGRLGRREKYSDKGLVRRSTRKRRSRISYDESDDEDEDEDQNDKWQSDESDEEEESESNSESDDATWGKRKKKGFAATKPKLSSFVLGASSSKGKGKGGVKRKKRKTDEDDVDRPWNSARGKRESEEPIERRTRGRKINFKDILDSGESDDDGNVRPKRRPLSDSDDSRSPSSSRRLAEEIRAENARRDKEYEESKAKMADVLAGTDKTNSETTAAIKETPNDTPPSVMPESLTVAKLAESSVNKTAAPTIPKVPLSPVPAQTSPIAPSPNSLPPISSPMHSTPSPSTVVAPPVTLPVHIPPNSSPVHLPTPPPPINLSSTVANASNAPNPSEILSKSPPSLPFIPKSMPSNLSIGSVLPNLPAGLLPPNLPTRPIPPNVSTGPVHSSLPTGSLPPNISSRVGPPNLSGGPIPTNLSIVTVPPGAPVGSSRKSLVSSVPPPVPVSIITDKKSHKQSKSSRGSRGSKSEKKLPPPISSPSDIELALSKPVKMSALGIPVTKSSSKKDRDREGSINVPNPSLLMAGAGGVLPELLGMGLPPSMRPGSAGSPSGGGSSSKKGKGSGSSSSRTTQQTTPPPVSQNLSPSLPIDIDRVPNPALFQGNPGMRPFHPMWAVRNPGPPPGYSPPGNSANLGKPPPLNTSPFSGQQGPPPRPGFSSPPPLRIPNPNTSPLQAFQHFKRDGPLGGPLYRLPSGQPQSGVPLSNIIPPGIMSPHGGVPERFFGAPPGYPHPYGLLPPHSQGPPQALFPYDYRTSESPFKDEPAPPPRTTSSSLPTPVSSASSSPPPTTSASVPLPTKDEGSAARDSEFGGLVSYFSSQRSEEDMDT